ncbi:SAF domain-containing protein [Microbacterium marinilacus]|nr:SAF domain-containing protein [Microbacterium marinilacus]MBY0687251.1 SAF domain-containing protein [Microbacterium marinilacus]
MSSISDRPVTPLARSRRRGFWADARFVIGVGLVAASIAGVWFVVGAARQTVAVLAAADTLVPGQPVTAADVSVVEVALGKAGDAYLAPDDLGDGLVVLRAVGAGELLPSAAVGDSDRSTRTAVVVRSSVDVPAGVERGALVELWETPAAEPGTFETPRVLVADAVVARVTREEGVMVTAGASLELVVDRADVPAVLAAVAAGSALSTVPAAGGALSAAEAVDGAGSDPAGEPAQDVTESETTEDAG